MADERPQGRPPAASSAATRPRIDRRPPHDSNRFRAALEAKGIEPCIPSTRSRKVELPYDKALYRQRHRIEIMFERQKDWRRIATRYDRASANFPVQAQNPPKQEFLS